MEKSDEFVRAIEIVPATSARALSRRETVAPLTLGGNMAAFLSASLTHSTSGSNVQFRVDARIKFQSHELNTWWFLSMTFKEEDTFRDDKLRSVNRSFLASRAEQDVSFSESIAKSTVDTEWGSEEVYADLQVVPLEAPPAFEIDTAKTNKTNVDV
jgi:hypothetical protein